MKTIKKYNNHLQNEESPYLLQHAHQPVDWYPWGSEAFEKAKTENKLIIISIGYSACHWCHVMAHESFEDLETAEIMNENFVCIKIDREERPDTDAYYMDAVNLITGRGGWPLNCITLPSGEAVWGGAYFPKAQWKRILQELNSSWKRSPADFIRAANDINKEIKKYNKIGLTAEKHNISTGELKKLLEITLDRGDIKNGGFKEAPKFPMPGLWQAFLKAWFYTKDDKLLEHTVLTLDKMIAGGLYDRVGGGFARYSVDGIWQVPHFEKMLYDNAQMLSLYSQAYKLTKKKTYKKIVYQTLDFLLSELHSPNGGFYSALDADSEGEEGKYYVWTEKEIDEILAEKSLMFKKYFSISSGGNWENGKNILYAKVSIDDFASQNNLEVKIFEKEIDENLKLLHRKRKKRVAPALDNKIITSWNALLIKGFADAYEAFSYEKCLQLSEDLTTLILKRLQKNGMIWRLSKQMGENVPGFLDDYAYFISALIKLFEHTGNEYYFSSAKLMTDFVMENFYDKEKGLFYYSYKHGVDVPMRKSELVDNVMPSSSAVMAGNLFLLSKITGNVSYLSVYEGLTARMVDAVKGNLRFHYYWFELLCYGVYPFREAVISGSEARSNAVEIRFVFRPDLITVLCSNQSELSLLKDRYKNDNVFYLCENGACKLPVHTVNDFWNLV